MILRKVIYTEQIRNIFLKKNLREIRISFKKGYSDSIYGYLYRKGISTVLEERNSYKFYIPEIHCGKVIEGLIKSGLKGITAVRSVPYKDKNWNREWEKSIKPVNVKNKIIVYPSWFKESVKKYSNKILIQIDPKMSFGTGHNETTQLMLGMMTDYIDSDDRYLLDFGCGSGVLAIAGIKLGIEKAVAIDIDEDSIMNSRENFEINRVKQYIKLYRKSIDSIRDKNFDIIAANIISGVITKNAKIISNKLKDNGKLFLSGILAGEKKKIIAVLKKNKFKTMEINRKAEWLGIYAKKVKD